MQKLRYRTNIGHPLFARALPKAHDKPIRIREPTKSTSAYNYYYNTSQRHSE